MDRRHRHRRDGPHLGCRDTASPGSRRPATTRRWSGSTGAPTRPAWRRGARTARHRSRRSPTDGIRELLSFSAGDSSGGLGGVAFSPDGERLMTGNSAITAVKIWDASTTGGGEWANVASVPQEARSVPFGGLHARRPRPRGEPHGWHCDGLGHRDRRATRHHRAALCRRRARRMARRERRRPADRDHELERSGQRLGRGDRRAPLRGACRRPSRPVHVGPRMEPRQQAARRRRQR